MASAVRAMAHRRGADPAPAGGTVPVTRNPISAASGPLAPIVAPQTVAALAAGDGAQARAIRLVARLLRDGWAQARLRPRLALAAAAMVAISAVGLVAGPSTVQPGGIDAIGLTGKLVAVAGLLFLTLMGLRRVQAGSLGADRRMTVLETRSLGPKASLHLVAVGERRLVVGLTPAGMVSLAELHASELDDAAPDGVPADQADLRVQAFEPALAAEAAFEPALAAEAAVDLNPLAARA